MICLDIIKIPGSSAKLFVQIGHIRPFQFDVSEIKPGRVVIPHVGEHDGILLDRAHQVSGEIMGKMIFASICPVIILVQDDKRQN